MEEEAAAAIVWLAEKVSEYVAGKVLSSITGDGTFRDIQKLVRQAITEINAFTRTAIEEDRIRELSATMDAVSYNLWKYAQFNGDEEQQANEFLLTDAILKSGNAIAQCKTFGIPAVFCFANAVSLTLIAQIAYYKLKGTDQAKTYIIEQIKDAKAFIATIVPPWEASWDPNNRIHVPSLDKACNWRDVPGDAEPAQYVGECYLNIDGNPTEVFSGPGPIDEGYWNGIVQYYIGGAQQDQTNAITSVKVPLDKAVAAWDKVIPAFQ
jgi:hypothetical protein